MGPAESDAATQTSNRPPGIGDSLRENSSFGTVAGTAKSRSGIFDVSRMTNVASVTSGQTVAASARGTLSGIFFAVLLPLLVIGYYFEFRQTENRTSNFGAIRPALSANRKPAAHASLPAQIKLEVPVSENAGLGARAAKAQATGRTSPMPFKFELDSSGTMTSPFQAELDENGNQNARVEYKDFLSHLPPLPFGQFQNANAASTVNANGYAAVSVARPFAFTDLERKRINELATTAFEIKKMITDSESATLALTEIPSTSLAMLEPKAINWLQFASFARDISGVLADGKRLTKTLLQLATSYKPTGDVAIEMPLFEALTAYDRTRHLFSDSDRSNVDHFFHTIVDAQFLKFKNHKLYDGMHASHLRFALAVGFVTGNGGLQSYGLEQFKNHIESTSFRNMDSLGEADVKRLGELLHAAFVIERSHSVVYQNPTLNHAVDLLVTQSQASSTSFLAAAGTAAYFRPELYKLLRIAAQNSGIPGSRFGTSEGALLAALRKPTTSFTASTPREPSALPSKLPPKRP